MFKKIKSQNSLDNIVIKQLSVLNNVFVALSVIIVLVSIIIGLFSYLTSKDLRTENDVLNKRIDDKLSYYEDKNEKNHQVMEDNLSSKENYIDQKMSSFSNISEQKINQALNQLDTKFDKLSGEKLKKPKVAIYYNGQRYSISDSSKIKIYSDNGSFTTYPFKIANIGDKEISNFSIRIFFIDEIKLNPSGGWQQQSSSDSPFKTELYWGQEFPTTVNPGEKWEVSSLKFSINKNIREVKARMKVFYGVEEPEIADLIFINSSAK